jgi:hypothetical protein
MIFAVLTILGAFLFYLYPGLFLIRKTRGNWWKVLLVSYVFNTLGWFWILWFFKLSKPLLLGGYFFLSLISIILARKLNLDSSDGESSSERANLSFRLIFGLITLYFLIATFFTYLPLIKPVFADGYKFFRFPGINDALKHLFVVNSIKESGLPPVHPYFAKGSLSYYYGFYILPAIVSLLTKLDSNLAFLIHLLVSIFLYLILLFKLINFWIKNYWGKIFAFLFATVGFGWDIIPTLILPRGPIHIETWMCALKHNLQITSFLTAALWVPQHLLATLISLLVVTVLLKLKPDKKVLLLAVFLTTFVCLSSVFVAISLAVFILAVSLRKIWVEKENLNQVLSRYSFLGLGVALVLAPFLFTLLSQRGNLLRFQLVYPHLGFPWLPNFPPLNLILNLFFEFGGAIFLFFLIGLKLVKKEGQFAFLLIPALAMLLAVHIIVSPTTNDFGMRGILMAQVLISIFAGWAAGEVVSFCRREKRKVGLIVVFFFLGTSFLISFAGQVFEIYGRWKERKVLPWEESQLLEWVMKNTRWGQRLATLESREAEAEVEMIPVIAGRMTYSLGVYGASVYLVPKDGQTRKKYGVAEIKDFFERDVDFDLRLFLKKVGDWLAYTRPDYVILRNQIWVEEDKDPLVKTLKDLFPESFQEIANYTIFDYQKMDKQRFYQARQELVLLFSQKLDWPEAEFNLKGGLYLIKICAKNPTDELMPLIVDIRRHYSLFKTSLSPKERKCFSRLFLAPSDKAYTFLSRVSEEVEMEIEFQKFFISFNNY